MREKKVAVKQLRTIEPTHFQRDKKGNLIPVYRGGIQDTNKYANKTPFERQIDKNMGNPNYKPKVGQDND